MSQPDNTLIVMWAAKGGAGTTVTAAAAALHETDHVLLVDLDGDAGAVLGLRPHELGVRAWLASDAEPDRLIEFTDRYDDSTSLIQAGTADPERGIHRSDRLEELATWLKRQAGIVLVDVGTRPPPPELHFAADRNVLVTRADYLALTRAQQALLRPDEVFVVDEPGRSLTHTDIERALHAPVVGAVDINPSIARAVDAGLFQGHASLVHATNLLTSTRSLDTASIDNPSVDVATATSRPAARGGPEVDYGMQWRSTRNPDTWRLSYDPDTQILHAANNRTGAEVGLAIYANTDAVESDIAGWATNHGDANGLDWLTEQLGVDPAALQTASLPDLEPPTPPTPDLGIDL